LGTRKSFLIYPAFEERIDLNNRRGASRKAFPNGVWERENK